AVCVFAATSQVASADRMKQWSRDDFGTDFNLVPKREFGVDPPDENNSDYRHRKMHFRLVKYWKIWAEPPWIKSCANFNASSSIFFKKEMGSGVSHNLWRNLHFCPRNFNSPSELHQKRGSATWLAEPAFWRLLTWGWRNHPLHNCICRD
ncbi:MAG TPA: hypothetical protein VKE98_19870, partial [Gemmataceae bacterium]|nr:hypothetical protein [Gemmataceae bacterium]